MPAPITDADFDAQVLRSPVPVVVDFWAPWCGPCRGMHTVLDELDADLGGTVRFVQVNVEEHGEAAGRYDVMGFPTFIVFRDGAPTAAVTGSRSKEDMRALIEQAAA
jgi:thioredoxin 1